MATVAAGELPLRELRDVPPEQRASLVLRMLRYSTGDARQSVLRVGAELVPESDLVALLRNEGDDVARNGGLEMLKLRGRRALPCALALLADADDDVVMQGVQLVNGIGDPRSWPDVRRLLLHANPNVVQAVIAAAPRIGGRSAAVDLLRFLDSDSWLQITAIDSLGRLRARLAVPYLRRLLDDPLACDFAAEALARVGGLVSVHVLADYFSAHQQDLEPGRWLPLLACAFADLTRPWANGEMRELLRPYLATQHASAAAACMLALGASGDDADALNVLAAGSSGLGPRAVGLGPADRDTGGGNRGPRPEARGLAEPLPLCLSHRTDLVPLLLGGEPPKSDWGFALARRDPDLVSEKVLEKAFADHRPADPAVLAELAPRLTNVRLLVALFLDTTMEGRAALEPLLRRAGAQVAPIAESENIDAADRLLLLEISGADPELISRHIRGLDATRRISVLSQLRTAAVAERLPWREWIDADRRVCLPLFCDLVARCRSDRLLALFRILLRQQPSPELIKSAGAIGDRESVPLLIGAYDEASTLGRAFLLEALGDIGGEEVRPFLRRAAFGAPGVETRMACRAFARCACASDIPLIEAMASHEDWAIRLAAIDALARLGAVTSPVLTVLVADPSAVVAQKASTLLDLAGSEE